MVNFELVFGAGFLATCLATAKLLTALSS